MGRILVIRGGALGDFILTLPVLAALRARFPRVPIEVLGYPAIARIAVAGRLADAVHAIEARPLAEFFAANADPDPHMAEFFGRFAVILSFLYDPDGIFRENVTRCGAGQFIAGPHRPADPGRQHAIECFLEPLERLAIFEQDAVPRLELEPAPTGPGTWLAVHPGSGSESKNWPERRWAELLRRVVAGSNLNLLILGGEAEGDRLERLAAPLPASRVRVARSQPLDRVAALLRGCHHFVGHDSGVTHLAAAVGLPCLVLWGPSNPVVWRPRGEQILVMQDDCGLPGLACDTVWEVLHRRLGLNPAPAPAGERDASVPPATRSPNP